MTTSTTFTASIFMNRAFEKAAQTSAVDFATSCVHQLAVTYNFNVDEALTSLNMDQVEVKKAASRKKGEGKPKSPKSVTVRVKRETPTIPLPWTGLAVVGWCSGLRLNHNLHSQCCMEPLEGGEFCKTCQKQADSNANGIPTYGSVASRMTSGLLEFRDPKQNKQTIPYANVMKKLNITREAAETEAAKFGMTIPEEHFVIRESKRGRPKKDAAISDTESDTSTSSGIAKKRGRPKKDKKVIVASVGDDLIASLVAQSSGNSDTAVTTPVTAVTTPVTAVTTPVTTVTTPVTPVTIPVTAVTTVVAPSAKKAVSPKKSPEEKAARKAAQKAKIEELRGEWVTLANSRLGKVSPQFVNGASFDVNSNEESVVAEAAAAMTKIGDLQKAVAAMKRVIKTDDKESALVAAAAAAKAKELELEKLQDDGPDGIDEMKDDDAVEVIKFEFEGKKYLKSSDNVLYDAVSQEQIGVWDPDTNSIQEIEEMSDSDDDEDEN